MGPSVSTATGYKVYLSDKSEYFAILRAAALQRVHREPKPPHGAGAATDTCQTTGLPALHGMRVIPYGRAKTGSFLGNSSSLCRRPSVCHMSSVSLSVVCNVCVPYSAGWNFRHCFYAMVPWPSVDFLVKKFTEIIPGEPLRRSNKNGSECSWEWFWCNCFNNSSGN